MILERLNAVSPAMSGAMAIDLRRLAGRTIDRIDGIIAEWDEGATLDYSLEEYEGDFSLTGDLHLAERGEWYSIGDEIYCSEYHDPVVDYAQLTLTYESDNGDTWSIDVDAQGLQKLASYERH